MTHARAVWALLALGAGLRIWLILTTPGATPDIDVLVRVAHLALHAPLSEYDVVREYTAGAPGWPYASGYFPILAATQAFSELTDIAPARAVRLPVAVADLGLALLAERFLAGRGASERKRLAAVGLLALGPCLITTSSVHGQFDALAFLPAFVALTYWTTTSRVGSRAVVAGALVGLGASMKLVPGLMLLALLASARGRREAAILLTVFGATFAALWLPWLVADHELALAGIREYRGVYGRGGLSLLVQPDLALRLSGEQPQPSELASALYRNTTLLIVPSLLLLTLALHARRAPAPLAALAVLAMFHVVTPTVLPQYWMWLVPALVIAGHLGAAAVLQLALTPILLAIYHPVLFPTGADPRLLPRTLVQFGYVPIVGLVSGGLVVLLVALLRSTGRGAPRLSDAQT